MCEAEGMGLAPWGALGKQTNPLLPVTPIDIYLMLMSI